MDDGYLPTLGQKFYFDFPDSIILKNHPLLNRIAQFLCALLELIHTRQMKGTRLCWFSTQYNSEE